ncbi:dephospho-CoA kinase [Pedobacter alpinus]|uniref:Dephospho-CoA kinase n=1 Tax=Pedobacter alpinus TaxID=1590643 RepID=A0ABW5TUX8_9SPHI
MMLTIGITGGIGSGKTTVCKIFELLGIPVFYADDVAKHLMVTDEILIDQIKLEFGSAAYLEDGSLNRKHISSIVFSESQKLQKLNSFVHPAVFRAMDSWVKKQNSLYVLKEAALLFESGSYLQNNYNVLVSAPEKARIARVMQRDNISEEKVLERIKSQMSEEEKLAKADFFINNNEQEFLIMQVLKLHHIFTEKALKKD